MGTQDTKTTYRYLRLRDNNYELAAPDTAEVIGKYITGTDGLPQHVGDLPLGSIPEVLIERAD